MGTPKHTKNAILDSKKPVPVRHRDGAWTCNGLVADFVHLYAHPSADGIHRVLTASGEHYAPESELRWDVDGACFSTFT